MVVLNRFRAMGDWDMYQVLFLYALNNLAYAIGATFIMGSFGKLSNNIQSGEFDAVLTKPVNPLAYFICRHISAGYTSNYVMGVGVMIYSVMMMDIRITVGSIALIVLMVLCASVISGAMFAICSIPAFWIVRNESLSRLFFSNPRNFINYPISIYTKGIQVLLTFILPYAFISYYPTTLLFNPDNTLFSPILAYCTPLVAVLVALIGYGFWKIGINSYQSTGS
jgi:ABC-2 type transport system permease protein